jgi:hypothetical protein
LFADLDPTIVPSRIRIPDPGGKKAPDPDPQHWFKLEKMRKYWTDFEMLCEGAYLCAACASAVFYYCAVNRLFQSHKSCQPYRMQNSY